MKCTNVYAAQITNLFLKEHNFPCLADEIAEPRPDMNIKVAAFTVSQKSINNCIFIQMDEFTRWQHEHSVTVFLFRWMRLLNGSMVNQPS